MGGRSETNPIDGVEPPATRSGGATPDAANQRWRDHTTLACWHLLPLVPFVVLRTYFDRRAVLSEEAYRRPVITWEWLASVPALELLLLTIVAVTLVRFREPLRPWHDWTNGATLRVLVGVATSALAWWFVTADVNLFVGRTHVIDRLLLVALAAAVWWRPVFVLPFLVVLLAFDGQFHHPLGRHSVAQISLPSNLLFLFVAAHLVQIVTRRAMARHFVFLTFCMIAASYVVPGLGKLRLGWLGHRNIHLMIFSSHSVGWLGTAGASTIETLGRWMEVFEWPMVVMTIVVECGAVFMLVRRATALSWLALFVGLNTMILLTTGIFFWTWIVINATLLVLLWRGRDASAFDVFSGRAFLVSVPVIALGGVLFDPVELAWLDAPINYTYRLEATTSSGQRTMIATGALAPYDTQFALADFTHLSEEPHLGVVWGAVHDRDLAGSLVAARTPEEIWEIERGRGWITFDADAAAEFDRFVREVVGRWNAGTDRTVPVLGWLPAPKQVWLTSHASGGPPGEPIKAIAVHQVVSFYDGDTYRIIRDRIVREIDIEAPP